MSKLIKSQFGYNRLTMITTFIMVALVSVIMYQTYAASGLFFSGEQEADDVDAYTSVQIFSQTLPVYPDVFYELRLGAHDDEYSKVEFYMDESRNIYSLTGDIVENGVFDLAEGFTDYSWAKIYMKDESSVDAEIEFLEGNIDNGRAVLQFMGINDISFSGEVMLATPTDGNNLINERSGAWFGNVISNKSALKLAELPAGWIYEGWVVYNSMPITTGRFNANSNKDQFSGFSMDEALPPAMPGEDFLRNPPDSVFPGLRFPLDLAGQRIMITIEPDINGVDPTGAAPFPQTVLSLALPRFAETAVLYPMTMNKSGFPKATIVIR